MIVLPDEVRLANSTVQARLVTATDQLDRAILATIQWIAVAVIVRTTIVTCTVHARTVFLALINVDLTVFAFITVVTLARVTTNTVLAEARLARRTVALVYVDLTVLAGYSRYTETLVAEKKEKLRLGCFLKVVYFFYPAASE